MKSSRKLPVTRGYARQNCFGVAVPGDHGKCPKIEVSGIQFSYTPIEYLNLKILIRLVIGKVPAFVQKSEVWGKNDPSG